MYCVFLQLVLFIKVHDMTISDCVVFVAVAAPAVVGKLMKYMLQSEQHVVNDILSNLAAVSIGIMCCGWSHTQWRNWCFRRPGAEALTCAPSKVVT